MLVCASYKTRLALAFLLSLLADTGNADTYAANIQYVSVNQLNQYYCVNAEINYGLSPKALEALQNGVALHWTVRIKLIQPRDWWWDMTLAELRIRYRLQYHALLNMYRVKNKDGFTLQNFSTLAAALASMSKLEAIPIIEVGAVSEPLKPALKIQVHFDREALPLPLQPMAYLNPAWYLSSEWLTWPLSK